jgi:hypothetical protein
MKRLFAVLFFGLTLLHADPRTFTDQFGREITAQLISVDGDQIRIRRDDGQIFTLSASKLTDADQKYIKQWAASQPAAQPSPGVEKSTPDPKKILVNLSRGKFETRTIMKFDSYTHKHEQWGYSIQITNQHLQPVSNLRIEYNLFARTFADTSSPSLISGTKTIETLASRRSEVFRTTSAEVCKTRDTYFGYNSQGEMKGIWLRIYADNQLIIEQSSPESLMKDEKWSKVQTQ